MSSVDLNFDVDVLRQAVYGFKMINEVGKRLPHISIEGKDIRISYQYSGWITNLATKIFSFLIKEEKDEIKSCEVSEIESVIEEIGYKTFHKDFCFDAYVGCEEEVEFKCGLCRECKECRSIFKEYLEAITLREKRVKLDEMVDVSKIDKENLRYIPNLISRYFAIDNVVNDIYVSEFTNEIIIEYIDDDSGYFAALRDNDEKNGKTIFDIVYKIERGN